MHFISHRINQVEALRQVPAQFGCEIDLRDRGERLILQHDPFKDGEDAEPFFAEYKEHGTLILNVKSERIEDTILPLMQKYKIENYFFLDSSLPMIVNLTKRGEKRIALRYSEFEAIETVLNFAGLVDWVWIDCFTRLSLDKNDYKLLKDAGFKLCLVSPELQGRPEDIPAYKKQMADDQIVMDAICTKQYNIELWSA
ncbi:N/A [soil metagenome]